ncbi:MAG: Gfo/Idh/MocA family oxidoreductase [Acidobacteria bacterium]|nr:Gfo/Idh/MocA family oxidoreductase [Acidobacteriota bacterium]
MKTTKSLGVGIVGTGWVSGEYIKAALHNPNCEITGICSRSPSRAESIIREYGLSNCRVTADLSQMLAQDDVDIVVLCTPNFLHAEQGIAAARAGKHVIVEKPVAIDLPSLRKLDKAVKSAGVKTVVSFVLRWNPMFDNIRAMLSQKLIGKLFYAEVDYMHAIDVRNRLHRWHNKKELGGGALLAAGCHAVDGLRWFMQDEAVEVSAYSARSKKNPLRFDFDPNIVAMVKFAGGAVGKVACSLEAQMPYVYRVMLFGDQGTIRDNQLFTTNWPGQKDWAEIPTVLPSSGDVTHHPFQGELDHFVDCIQQGKESHCNVADAVKTHEICIAADRSAATGKPVKLPLR